MRLTFNFCALCAPHAQKYPWYGSPLTHKKWAALACIYAKRLHIFAESRSRPTGFIILSRPDNCILLQRISPTFNTLAKLSAAFIYFRHQLLRNKYDARYEIRSYSNAEPASIKFYFAHFSLNERHVAEIKTWIFGAREHWERIVAICTQWHTHNSSYKHGGIWFSFSWFLF